MKKRLSTVIMIAVMVVTLMPFSDFIVRADSDPQRVATDIWNNGTALDDGSHAVSATMSEGGDYTVTISYDPSDNNIDFGLSAEVYSNGYKAMVLSGMTYNLDAGNFEPGGFQMNYSYRREYFTAQANMPMNYIFRDNMDFTIVEQSYGITVVDNSELMQDTVCIDMLLWNTLLKDNFGYGMEMIFPDFFGNESNMTPTPTTAPTQAPAAPRLPEFVPDNSEPGVSGFVERLYTIAMGRSSDPTGKQNWIDAITQRGSTGADAARGFLLSSEFANKGYSNEDFVEVLYRTFFNRTADESGRAAWVGVLNNGSSREEVINGFINSTEWANLCLTYGIASGGTGTPNVDIEPNQATIDFATRLYTTCLNRNADQNGLMAWARQLANQRDTGTGAARGFFFSTEFVNQNVDNAEYVTRLYRTFMGREPDQAGFDAWVGQLNAGVSREEVFDGFSQSQEFTAICAQYGIIRG